MCMIEIVLIVDDFNRLKYNLYFISKSMGDMK
jgi:hypothetical protein|nr:MAG TPA: hypothetical protein [Crassvirales sp.]DAX30307.1 MAG TPA: hypothetical protein [Crassvirales sp.]